MLAIQLAEIEWFKDSRNPEGARQRAHFLQPQQIATEISPVCSQAGEKQIFLQKLSYYQHDGQIKSAQDGLALWEQRLNKGKGSPFTGIDEYEEKNILRVKNRIEAAKGNFCSLEKLNIPCLTITPEQENSYRIKWYDSGEGMPRRRGGNEDLYKEGAKLAGKPNTLNETAFVLTQGESGVLRYNYRYPGFDDGQSSYKCYHVYLVNADSPYRDIFLRDYDYEYEQLAHLF